MNDREDELLPIPEAAEAIGCPAATLAEACQRAAVFDPCGVLTADGWRVLAWELEGNRLAMHKRRLCTEASVGTVQP